MSQCTLFEVHDETITMYSIGTYIFMDKVYIGHTKYIAIWIANDMVSKSKIYNSLTEKSVSVGIMCVGNQESKLTTLTGPTFSS